MSDLTMRIKGRSSQKLQQELPTLEKRYLGCHFWAIAYGCWSTVNITDEILNDYLGHHRNPTDNLGSDFIIEE
jgi:putative transposase